jgi:hypothetical protein
VRDLELLGLVLEARSPVGPEEALRRVEPVTAVAIGDDVAGRAAEEVAARFWLGVRELSSARTGFGGSVTSRMKSVKAFMSASGSPLVAAEQPVERDVERLKCEALVERIAGRLGVPPVRSPRQCIGP